MVKYEIVLGNDERAYDGSFCYAALENFKMYREQARHDMGRAAGKTVVLFENGQPILEFDPHAGRKNREDRPPAIPANLVSLVAASLRMVHLFTGGALGLMTEERRAEIDVFVDKLRAWQAGQENNKTKGATKNANRNRSRKRSPLSGR